MDYHLQLGLVRFAKFLALLLYAAALGVGLANFDASTRKRAIHLWASPALIVVWLCGYVLTLYTGVALTQLWVAGGFALSLGAHLVVTRVARQPIVTASQRAVVLGLVGVTLCLMIFRPTWWSLTS